jgi:hypothetical protein
MEQNDNMHNIQQLLSNVQNIAIVGAKDKPSQPVNEVGRYLIQAGFTIFPVHPKRQNVWGLPTYQNLVDIPERIDLVNLFRASEFCVQHANEALQLNPLPQVFWMQQGVSSPEAKDLLDPYGIHIIENSCIKLAYQGKESSNIS